MSTTVNRLTIGFGTLFPKSGCKPRKPFRTTVMVPSSGPSLVQFILGSIFASLRLARNFIPFKEGIMDKCQLNFHYKLKLHLH